MSTQTPDQEKIRKAHYEAVLAEEFDSCGNFAEACRIARDVAGYTAGD